MSQYLLLSSISATPEKPSFARSYVSNTMCLDPKEFVKFRWNHVSYISTFDTFARVFHCMFCLCLFGIFSFLMANPTPPLLWYFDWPRSGYGRLVIDLATSSYTHARGNLSKNPCSCTSRTRGIFLPCLFSIWSPFERTGPEKMGFRYSATHPGGERKCNKRRKTWRLPRINSFCLLYL